GAQANDLQELLASHRLHGVSSGLTLATLGILVWDKVRSIPDLSYSYDTRCGVAPHGSFFCIAKDLAPGPQSLRARRGMCGVERLRQAKRSPWAFSPFDEKGRPVSSGLGDPTLGYSRGALRRHD